MNTLIDRLGALAWTGPWLAYTTTSALLLTAVAAHDLIRGARP